MIIMHSSFIIILTDRPGGKEETTKKEGFDSPGVYVPVKKAKFIDIMEETKIELRRWKSSSKVRCE